jgi:L-lysine 6-transaminase
VCGILASRRLDEVEDNVFHVPSRLNSTWGGNLADMVRFDRILEIIEEDDLVAHAGKVGAYLLQRLEEMAQVLPFMTNVRGRGLMCAFDLPTPAFRDAVRQQSLEEGVIVLGCGERSIRFRPPLVIVEEEIDEGLRRLRHALERVAQRLPWK